VSALAWAAAAGAVVWVGWPTRRPPTARWSQARSARPAPTPRRRARAPWSAGGPLARGAAAAPITAGALGGLLVLGGWGILAGAAAGSVAWAAVSRHRERGRASQSDEAVAGLLASLAAALRSGLRPPAAMAGCLPVDAPEPLAGDLRLIAAACASDGPVVDLLRAAATRPGAEALGWLAAVWAAAEDSGAPMGQAVSRLAQAARAARARRGEVAAELAGPVASARLLAALPVLGLVLGAGLGAQPLAFLTGPGWGRAVLAAGVALDAVGLWWVGRLARAAER
jgi:tight adherence protein B